MKRTQQKFAPARARGFTLIEILVTIAIIAILGAILMAVGTSVHRNSQISATRAELASLQGLADQYREANGADLPPTMYDTDGSGKIMTDGGSPPGLGPPAPPVTFADALYLNPATKDTLVKLAGDKLKNSGNHWAILDYFGNPISYVPKGCSSSNIPQDFPYAVPAVSGWSAVTVSYFRSSGPDGVTKWGAGNETAPENSNDILSSEAMR